VNGPRGLRKTARLDDSYKIIKMAVLHPPVLIGTKPRHLLHLKTMGLSSSPVVFPRAGRKRLRLPEAVRHEAGSSRSSQSYPLPIPAYRSGICF
jgi:hypothetical protein